MKSAPAIISLRDAEIMDARQMTFARKFWAGAELFDYACQITLDGIRSQNPTFSEEQIRAELKRRLDLRQRPEAQ